jgi:DNA-binding SARP family transcriptional activator/pimeloyl-ACP methyl ester carboxylesterase
VTMIRLLGPVDVVADGRPVVPRSRHARTMLAVLAVRAGQVVPTDTLTEALWGDDPPRTAPHALHVHASALRKLAGGLRIVGRPGGYVLRVGPGQLDTDLFEDLAARGRAELASGRADAAASALRAALAHWRGSALDDVPWERFADGDVPRWEELRQAAHEDLADAELAGGRHAEVVGQIEALVREQPYRERRWEQLMVALYRSGRQAEALDYYGQVRALLADELGIEPSSRLRRLHGQILRQDDSLGPTPTDGDVPVTRVARGPGGRLAYQVLGDGPRTIVLIPAFGANVELRWEEPALSRLYRRLARSARLVLYDKRGTGLSDREAGIPPIEDHVEDVLAVMDAAGVDRATLFGNTDGGAIALLTAAAHPDRVDGVVTYATFSAFDQLGAGGAAWVDLIDRQLDDGVLLEDALAVIAPSRARDPSFMRWLGRYARTALGVGGVMHLVDVFRRLDIRAALPDVTVPVLALHREHDPLVPADNADYIAAHVQDGRAVRLPGHDCVIWAGDVTVIADQVHDFVAAVAPIEADAPARPRPRRGAANP